MPIYEFRCRDCRHEFEVLVRGSERPLCPSCRGESLERMLSAIAVKTEATSHSAFKKAKRARKAQTREERFYEHHDHDDEERK